MKRLSTLFFAIIFAASMFGQESYTALKVKGADAPQIDGEIEAAWDYIEIVPVEKVPDNGNITEPEPGPDDFYAEFGMMWDPSGLYFILKVTDDIILIEDDNSSLDAVPADQWWTDDNLNLLFSKDLFNETFEQFEFAWQEGIDQEEKLSSDDWLNAALIDIELVESAWYQDGNNWTLESWISWEAFGDGGVPVSAGDVIQCEVRARDDDDGGSWETMFQWSTDSYGVESDGVGMGLVTLSSDEVEIAGIIEKSSNKLEAYLSNHAGAANLHLSLQNPSDVMVSIYGINGSIVREQVIENMSTGSQSVSLDLQGLNAGIYFVKVSSENKSSVLKFVKQ